MQDYQPVEKDRTRISKDTTFQGTIHAQKLTVEGKVRGNVKAESDVIIKNGAFIDGPIETKSINLQEGGSHRGTIKMERAPNEEEKFSLSFDLPHNVGRNIIIYSITALLYCRAFIHGMKEVLDVDKA